MTVPFLHEEQQPPPEGWGLLLGRYKARRPKGAGALYTHYTKVSPEGGGRGAPCPLRGNLCDRSPEADPAPRDLPPGAMGGAASARPAHGPACFAGAGGETPPIPPSFRKRK